MPSIHIHLRCDREIAVSDNEPYSEAAVQEILSTYASWAVTRTDGTRIVVPTHAVEYVIFARE
ncbi:MAG: hypothetical protein IT195_11710 [Microthrixaceae bacterium]|nr:hypothetical protein [Microthrixaceae bacterium]